MTNLVALGRVKEQAGIPVGVTTFNDILGRLLTDVSAAIRSRCRRNFGTETITSECHYHVRSTNVIQLKRLPVNSVSEVKAYPYMATTTPSTLVEDEDYRLLDSDAGLLELLVKQVYIPTGLESGVSTSPYEWDRVEVTYSAGESSVPAEVSRACALLTAHWFSQLGRPLTLKSYKLGDLAETFFDDSNWPPAVNELLLPYRVGKVGVI